MSLIKHTSFLNHKQSYFIFFESSLIISLAAFIALFKVDIPTKEQAAMYIPKQEVLHLETVISTTQQLTAPPTVDTPIPKPVDHIFEMQLLDLNLELLIPAPLSIPPEPFLADITEMQTTANSDIYTESLPELIGGYVGLQQRITYPPRAVRDKIEGRVVIQYIIDEKGKVRNPKILRGVRHDINREAIRALRKSRFRPVRIDGKLVPVEHVMHIVFKIKYPSS